VTQLMEERQKENRAKCFSQKHILSQVLITFITEVKKNTCYLSEQFCHFTKYFLCLIGVSGMATENSFCSSSTSSKGGSPETSSNTPGEMYFSYINTTVSSLCNDEIIQCCFCAVSTHAIGFEKMERAKHGGKR